MCIPIGKNSVQKKITCTLFPLFHKFHKLIIIIIVFINQIKIGTCRCKKNKGTLIAKNVWKYVLTSSLLLGGPT